jgi:hypothetical protein
MEYFLNGKNRENRKDAIQNIMKAARIHAVPPANTKSREVLGEENAARFGTPSRAREAVLLAEMLKGKTIPQAAKSSGMSRSAAYRASRKEEFQEALESGRAELLQSTIDRLRSNANKAADVLNEVASDRKADARWQGRVSAARETLAGLFRGVEVFELDRRLRKVEKLAREAQEK